MSWTIESVRDARVAPRDVYRLYADPSTWPAWGHNATRTHGEGPLVEGGTVDVRANYGRTYPCRILRLDADRALELEVRPPLMTVINTYEVEPTATGSRVRHALTVSGPLERPLRWIRLDRLYRRLLDKEVARVVSMAADRERSGVDAGAREDVTGTP